MEAFIDSIAGALEAGALAATKAAASQTLKSSYDVVRNYLKQKYSNVHLEDVESSPHSKDSKLLLRKDLADAGVQKDATLAQLLQNLVNTLAAQVPEAAKSLGFDLRDIHAALDVQIRRISAESAVSFRNIKSEQGNIIIEDVSQNPKN